MPTVTYSTTTAYNQTKKQASRGICASYETHSHTDSAGHQIEIVVDCDIKSK